MDKNILYLAKVFTPDKYPEDFEEWIVGIFDSEETAKAESENTLNYLRGAYPYFYDNGELSFRIEKYELNMNYWKGDNT